MARTKQTARKTAQNLPPPTDHDICNELMMIQMRLELLRSQMTVTEKFLIRCRLGDIKILPLHDEMSEMKEKRDEQKRQFDTDIGELTLLGSCPVNCLYHTEYDPLNMYNILNDITQKELASFEEKLKSEIAAKNKLTPPKEMIDKTETAKDATEDKSVLRKNTRTKDFISPTKFAKKQKVAENDPIGASAPIKIANQYQALAGNSTIPDPDIAVVPVATRKLPPINLKFQTNYKPIVKEISQKFPTSSTKLSGEFLKIFATSPDEHREHCNITNFLTEKGEQFFAIEPVAKRPQKVVIKGLPINTDVDDIKTDLTERGFDIIKVAQLTKAKTKFKLPFFLVELNKSPDSPDIFKLQNSAKIRENTSYANALKGDQKMAPPPEQTSNKSKETPLGENRQPAPAAEDESFGFMDAVIELKKFFTDYPSLLELGKKLRQAQGDERLDVFYRHLINN
ncbi:nucleic-acid-binding protein from transposon X-element [Trichonephila inaurata madagascariensis]|uniref:Nucleic-acid-binding protein from transposon X-element n=1 Tax=Trichonephila inaurata madagascariensis TaxID=2747483 RepID=A0A8X7CTC5_9ARAC|nr:nucleic-acid-binding protein from transposon X-element [Trichonephila inaurata madagascariensis]